MVRITAMLTQMDRSPETCAGRLTRVEGRLALPALPMFGAPRPERADAVRNRLAILEADDALVSRRGASCVKMDEVSWAAAGDQGLGGLQDRQAGAHGVRALRPG